MAAEAAVLCQDWEVGWGGVCHCGGSCAEVELLGSMWSSRSKAGSCCGSIGWDAFWREMRSALASASRMLGIEGSGWISADRDWVFSRPYS